MCWPEPVPEWANEYLPGLAFASATNSWIVPAPTEGWTAIAIGWIVTWVTGTKSRITSYGSALTTRCCVVIGSAVKSST